MGRRLGYFVLMLICGSPLNVVAQGRNADVQTLRVRRALERPSIMPARSMRLPEPVSKSRASQPAPGERRDSVWNGALIGAAIGGAGGYVWARNICGGTDDTECFVISAPVGILAGIGIGAAAGAVADALHK